MVTGANDSKWFQNPVSRFAILALCWTVVYRALSFACNRFFGWPLYGWVRVIFMGVFMALAFAFFIGRRRQTSPCLSVIGLFTNWPGPIVSTGPTGELMATSVGVRTLRQLHLLRENLEPVSPETAPGPAFAPHAGNHFRPQRVRAGS